MRTLFFFLFFFFLFVCFFTFRMILGKDKGELWVFNIGIWGRRWEHNSTEKRTQPHPCLTRGSGHYHASAAEFGCDTDQHICTAWNVPQAALHRSLLTPGLEQGSCCVYRVTMKLIVPENLHRKTPEKSGAELCDMFSSFTTTSNLITPLGRWLRHPWLQSMIPEIKNPSPQSHN